MPEGDWYCSRCKPNQQPQPQRKKRQAFVYTEEDEEAEDADGTAESEDDSDDSDSSALGALFDDSAYVVPATKLRFFVSILKLSLKLYPFNYPSVTSAIRIKKCAHVATKPTAIYSNARNVIATMIQNARI